MLAEALMFEDAFRQSAIDRMLREADGTENKSRLGANALLGASLAVARACAAQQRIPLYRYLGGINARTMPVPMMNVLNGGVHADNTVDLQEFMIMPVGAATFSDGLLMCSEVYHSLKNLLRIGGYSTSVGDEGGFAPNLRNSEEALSYLVDAIKMSGYEPGEDFKIAIDAAASELYDEESGLYVFPGEAEKAGVKIKRTAEEMVEYFRKLVDSFTICSIEDGLYGRTGKGGSF